MIEIHHPLHEVVAEKLQMIDSICSIIFKIYDLKIEHFPNGVYVSLIVDHKQEAANLLLQAICAADKHNIKLK